MDFVVAISILVLAVGILVNTYHFSQNNRAIDFSKGELVSEMAVSGYMPARHPDYCLSYSNGTSTCTGFSCTGNVLSSQRIVACPQGFCKMEVRSCE